MAFLSLVFLCKLRECCREGASSASYFCLFSLSCCCQPWPSNLPSSCCASRLAGNDNKELRVSRKPQLQDTMLEASEYEFDEREGQGPCLAPMKEHTLHHRELPDMMSALGTDVYNKIHTTSLTMSTFPLPHLPLQCGHHGGSPTPIDVRGEGVIRTPRPLRLVS